MDREKEIESIRRKIQKAKKEYEKVELPLRKLESLLFQPGLDDFIKSFIPSIIQTDSEKDTITLYF